MMKNINVLIFPAGSEVGLEVFNSLKYCKEVNIFGCGVDDFNQAKFLYEDYHVVKSIDENGWEEELNNLCCKLGIDYIFPAYDDVIVALSKNRQNLVSDVLIPSDTVCDITRSKSKTYDFLRGIVEVPELYKKNEISGFPVFMKPDMGQGSQGAVCLNNIEELVLKSKDITDPIFCEYLPGEEYTIDCFSDRDKGLLFSGVRKRRKIRNGISVNTLSLEIPEFNEFADKISSRLGMRGAWFFQVKKSSEGIFKLLEVAPRIAGSMSVYRVKGINFSLLTLYERARIPFSINQLDLQVELDRALSNRFSHSLQYEYLYIDLDDTLILRGEINIQAISLIYQRISLGKPVVLITKHDGDLNNYLERYRLLGMFDEIIRVAPNEKKSKYIKRLDSIFVDDSFSERMDVYETLGIPTFDCSMIELLVNQAKRIESNNNE